MHAMHPTLLYMFLLQVDLKIKTKQKIIGWIDLPCVDHKGSCTYDMQCPTSPSKHCPAVVQQHGLPCECPVKEVNVHTCLK